MWKGGHFQSGKRALQINETTQINVVFW